MTLTPLLTPLPHLDLSWSKKEAMQNWHLLLSKPREELRAEEQLRNQGFKVFHPLLKHYKLKQGKQKSIIESLFPRYLFIQLDDELNDWSTIRSTRGVAELVRFTDYPAVVPESVVNDLLKQVNEEGLIDQTQQETRLFKPGDRVEIREGSFKGWQGVVKEQDSDMRVVLLLKMLGREQSLQIPLAEIKAI
ncbi:transcription/translation regulatory transformer protein RfaH [Haliea sp. AH-315-K21]|uniref:Transcription/translation regulatory transformer protein RfaH n=1 Tax=SAR86 cluster bacterium TaxID=2030880 RepID=A0A2A5C969_9GAMM|nr:transcription/translation regulatory transformer protein RfaH [Haliea sp. AH-315-K21]MBN4075774.1 transcription/translation regulatory transformer protein RfaH [Gammaproteobacteria bacterium AH-315-E17]PCJ40419.1 MAG: transcription/translation regulatory transformer protein RfaH [SAR86 cluster bacterium]